MGRVDNDHRRRNIPAMTPPIVHDYLWETGARWTGQGVAVELGAWLGATSVPLLLGLRQAGYNRPYWVFDRWEANDEQVQKAKNNGVKLFKGQDLRDIYLSNVHAIYDEVFIFKGDISNTLEWYDDDPIEIILFDAPKRNPIFTKCMNHFLPNCIPGVTVIGLLDYYFWKRKSGKQRELFQAPIKFIEKNKDHFTLLAEWPDQCSCVFFKYVKELMI